mmetsp:Transcript_71627/g.124392  ORF Transcript_71627/g.124392 Transcript_71627/m.124392 type:complete len:633 (+) Transcript_71627:98-1996(+)
MLAPSNISDAAMSPKACEANIETPSTKADSSIAGSPGPLVEATVDRAPEADSHPFRGRSVAVVNDLTLQEQWYLYQQTRELKAAVKRGDGLSKFRLQCPEMAVYTIFMEDSTRTKESFRNAAEFHGMKVNMFDAKTSSFQKNETITDTIKMLCGYSTGQSLFVIRSKVEGVCRWLEESIAEFTQLRGFPRASFINAGDGRHEHPTQEFLDEFSFLEHKGWNTSSIHLALLGDLFHGRTVHSKVDGLKLYGSVDVDLIAPAELALPKTYEDRMTAAGFNVRKFSSIAEYLEQPKVAKIWYFTRLQLERMGDKVLDKSAELRKAVTFQREFVEKLPANSKFFHPLPRDARHPTLPFWLDNTELNGWDQQSQNGFFTRIVLLGMLGGLAAKNFSPAPELVLTPRKARPAKMIPASPQPSSDEISNNQLLSSMFSDFVKRDDDIDSEELAKRSAEVGLAPVSKGIVLDHLAEGQGVETIWAVMGMVRSVLGTNALGAMGVYRSKVKPEKAAGYLVVPDFNISSLDRLPLKKIAAMAPGSTLSVVEHGVVTSRFSLQVPPRIYNFNDISCKNPGCISNPANGQREVSAYFLRAEPTSEGKWAFTCKYCEHVHSFWQIWDYKHYQSCQSLTEFAGIQI